jgi:hypothetical protein
MKRLLQLALLLWSVTAIAQQMQVLDRMLAVVNNVPIFQSDWENAVRWEALMNGRSPESMTVTEQREVFNRLIERELIREQMKGFALKPIGDDEVKQKLQEVRADIKGAASDVGWKKLLAENGLSEGDAVAQVRTQLELLRFLDVRLRPMVRVDYRTIQNYYRNEYLPALQKQGAKEVPLSEVNDKIREILTQQRLEEQTNIWVETLRQAADIRYPKALAQAK